MVNCPTLYDLIIDRDYTNPILPLPDEYLTWPGKDQGKPNPQTLLDRYLSEPVTIGETKITDRID